MNKYQHWATETGLMVVVDGVGVLLDDDLNLADHLSSEQIAKVGAVLTELGARCTGLARTMAMPWQQVESSNISAIGYDPESQTLGIEFSRGATYHYADVPSTIYEQFANASSHGSFFHANIKNQYQHHQVR